MLCKICLKNYVGGNGEGVCQECSTSGTSYQVKNKEMGEENYEKEEWGGWKIVSRMLDNPDKLGIYPTSKCYQELYEFVMAQKDKARAETIKKILGLIEDWFWTQDGHFGMGQDWKDLEKEIFNKLK